MNACHASDHMIRLSISCQARHFAPLSRPFSSIINAAAVPNISADEVSPEKFKSLIVAEEPSQPFRYKCQQSTEKGLRAAQLMHALREEENRLVEVEVGTYDDREFATVSMRLGQYLDWLEEGNGTVGGSQLYLAQWRAEQDVGARSVCLSSANSSLDTRDPEIATCPHVHESSL